MSHSLPIFEKVLGSGKKRRKEIKAEKAENIGKMIMKDCRGGNIWFEVSQLVRFSYRI